jgi:hypothetical protein
VLILQLVRAFWSAIQRNSRFPQAVCAGVRIKATFWSTRLAFRISLSAATDELAINNAKQLAALSAGDLLAPGNYIERERRSMQPRFPFVHTPDASGARNNPKLYTA